MARKKSRKPSGISGMVKISSGGRSEFLPTPLPSDKPAIEAGIIEGALKSLEFAGLDVYHLAAKPVQLKEDNFDFELPTAKGTEFLDLIEFAPLQHHGGSYERAPNKYMVGELADQVWGIIEKKSRKYGHGRGMKLHLLIYTTDFRFLFSDSVLSLLTLWCARRRHAFRSIVYFVPIDQESGMARVVYPGVIPGTLLSWGDEQALRNHQVTNLDPRRTKPTPDGTGVVFDQNV